MARVYLFYNNITLASILTTYIQHSTAMHKICLVIVLFEMMYSSYNKGSRKLKDTCITWKPRWKSTVFHNTGVLTICTLIKISKSLKDSMWHTGYCVRLHHSLHGCVPTAISNHSVIRCASDCFCVSQSFLADACERMLDGSWNCCCVVDIKIKLCYMTVQNCCFR